MDSKNFYRIQIGLRSLKTAIDSLKNKTQILQNEDTYTLSFLLDISNDIELIQEKIKNYGQRI
jgi:hypothetical protein